MVITEVLFHIGYMYGLFNPHIATYGITVVGKLSEKNINFQLVSVDILFIPLNVLGRGSVVKYLDRGCWKHNLILRV